MPEPLSTNYILFQTNIATQTIKRFRTLEEAKQTILVYRTKHPQNSYCVARVIENTIHRQTKLTRREKEVLDLVLCGTSSKCIAFTLGIAQRTVEGHRFRFMKKLGIRSVALLGTLRLDETGALK